MTTVKLHIAPDQSRRGFERSHDQNNCGQIEKPYCFMPKINNKFFSMTNIIINFKRYFATI